MTKDEQMKELIEEYVRNQELTKLWLTKTESGFIPDTETPEKALEDCKLTLAKMRLLREAETLEPKGGE